MYEQPNRQEGLFIIIFYRQFKLYIFEGQNWLQQWFLGWHCHICAAARVWRKHSGKYCIFIIILVFFGICFFLFIKCVILVPCEWLLVRDNHVTFGCSQEQETRTWIYSRFSWVNSSSPCWDQEKGNSSDHQWGRQRLERDFYNIKLV